MIKKKYSISPALISASIGALGVALMVQDAFAQTASEEVVVTGTRTTGLKAIDSPAPVQVLDSQSLARVGQTDLVQALAQNVPSFTAQAFGGDTAALTLSAKLRGLSPNHALVLINGKRRHGTANLAVLGGPYQGGASADLNFVPVASIDHVEVLLEGAAAQYGTDAIAGVINIIQKKGNGGSLTLTGGRYMDGDGDTADLSGAYGFEPDDKSYVNVSFQSKYHGYSNRGAIDPRTIDTAYNIGATNSPAKSYPQIVNSPGYPFLNKIHGDAAYHLNVGTYSAGYELTPDLQIYSFGSYGEKSASAFENYRLPNVVRGVATTDIPFPLGFFPQEHIEEVDYSSTIGASGAFGGLNWDLSTTYGSDDDIVSVLGTANADLYRDTSTATTKGFTPRNFLAGGFTNTQWSTTLDLSQEIEMGMATPLTIAGGFEYREETYEISPGEPGSYYKGGSQSYFGFAPVNAGKHGRNNKAVYLDFAGSPIAALQLDAAVRYETFSDFGDTTVAKLTGRYDFIPEFAVRGTVSTGFRAPTLAEEYYSGINVGPSSISGQLPPNSAGASLIGINGLKAEKSKNYSAGFVAHPLAGLTITLDAYQIEIEDRIVGSGTLYSANSNAAIITSPSVTAALVANGTNVDQSIFSNASYSVGVNMFVNGLDTRTKGVDLVSSYVTDFGSYGKVDWSLAASYADTKVIKISPPPTNLSPGVSLFDVISIANLEDATPQYRVTLGGLWTIGKVSVNLKESFFGESSNLTLDSFGTPAYRRTTIDPTAITDLDISYKVLDSVKVSVGANNLFNVYPDGINADLRDHYYRQNSNSFVPVYPTFSPFGINGGFFYAKVGYTF